MSEEANDEKISETFLKAHIDGKSVSLGQKPSPTADLLPIAPSEIWSPKNVSKSPEIENATAVRKHSDSERAPRSPSLSNPEVVASHGNPEASPTKGRSGNTDRLDTDPTFSGTDTDLDDSFGEFQCPPEPMSMPDFVAPAAAPIATDPMSVYAPVVAGLPNIPLVAQPAPVVTPVPTPPITVTPTPTVGLVLGAAPAAPPVMPTTVPLPAAAPVVAGPSVTATSVPVATGSTQIPPVAPAQMIAPIAIAGTQLASPAAHTPSRVTPMIPNVIEPNPQSPMSSPAADAVSASSPSPSPHTHMTNSPTNTISSLPASSSPSPEVSSLAQQANTSSDNSTTYVALAAPTPLASMKVESADCTTAVPELRASFSTDVSLLVSEPSALLEDTEKGTELKSVVTHCILASG